MDLSKTEKLEMSHQENLSVVLYGPNDLRMENRPVTEPRSNEVLLKINSVGICGSDIHVWKYGRIANFVVDQPLILGHEFSGTVVKVGSEVKHLKAGDRVAVEPSFPEETDEFVKSGRYNLALKDHIAGIFPNDGAMCQYFAHNANYCFKLPDSISFEEAALIEPLSVAIHACHRGEVKIGKTIFISGSGTIGLMCMLAAKAMGAAQVVISGMVNMWKKKEKSFSRGCKKRQMSVDPESERNELINVADLLDNVDSRLEMAKKLGADFTIKVDGETPQILAKKVEAALGAMPHISLESTGSELCIQASLNATRSGGTLVLIGLKQDYVSIPVVEAISREVDIRGIFKYCNTWHLAINMLELKRIDVKPLVTHRFPLNEALKAFETTMEDARIKVMLKCDPSDLD